MNVETQIKLDRFKPRGYQLPICDALENRRFRKLLAVWPRRAGKDLVAFNLMIRAALRTVGVYFYFLPTYRQAKLVIWDSITNTGEKFLDYIPPELIEKVNQVEMKISLINGSHIQFLGSDSYDTIVGTNPRMCIFSEYALADPRAYTLFARPVLNANDGTVIIISTPRGKNSLFELFQVAQYSPDWFCERLSLDDTKHISWNMIEAEIASGEISRDLAEQEYRCSFEIGIEGAYYTKYVDKMRLNGQICTVPWEPQFPVHTAWDLGMRDSTVIIFFQVIGQTIRIIDCYENSKEGLEHYIKVIKNKEYTYGKHIAPHDIAVRELGTGMSRLEKARHLGLSFMVAPNLSIMDGIEAVRSTLPKMWIDDKKCATLLKAIENYRQEYDIKKKVYKDHPLHDENSHYADAMRYLCLSLPRTRDGLSAKELDSRYHEAMYGDQLPDMFNDKFKHQF